MRLGIIGGTGSSGLFPSGAAVTLPPSAHQWGAPSSPVSRTAIRGHEVLFLTRHGPPDGSAIAPHRVNYRANVWVMHELKVDHLLAINTVGGISTAASPGRLLIPDQIIDYTWGRQHTYAGDGGRPLQHVDFTEPFDPTLRMRLLDAARHAGLDHLPTGTYGTTQGPRLESAAEITRLERDGCDVVGMTGMPEVGLARELLLSCAMCCLVVNHAAGRSPPGRTIHIEVADYLERGMRDVARLIDSLLALLPGD